jgi:hypothetical protein
MKATTRAALLFALSCHPAAAGRVIPFTGTGLDHCKARGEHRIPVPVWLGAASTSARSAPYSPPPMLPGGSFVYIAFGADVDEATPDILSGGAVYPDSCGRFSYSPLVSFDLPKDEKNPTAGGIRLHLRTLGRFSHGVCYYDGFFLSEPASQTGQGWTDVTFDAYDKIPPRDRYCLADVNTAPRPGPRKALPPCDRTTHRVPIPTWRPAVSAVGGLTSDPPQQPGMIVSISILVERGADGECVGWQDGEFRFFRRKPLDVVASPRLVVFLRGNDSAGPTSCRLSGLYLNEPIFAGENGRTATSFASIDANRVIDSGQYCLAREEEDK